MRSRTQEADLGAVCSLLQLIQLCKAKGIKTINVVRRHEQIADLKSIGCSAPTAFYCFSVF